MAINTQPRTHRWLERCDRDLAAIEHEIMAAGGEVTEEQEQSIARLCQERATLATDACYALDAQIEHLTAILAQAKLIVSLLETRRKAYAKLAVRQIDREGDNANKVKTDFYRAHTAGGAGKLELAVAVEELPEQYRREKREWVAETTLIKAALKAGMEITTDDGRQCAKLIEGRHLVLVPNKAAEIVQELQEAIGLEAK